MSEHREHFEIGNLTLTDPNPTEFIGFIKRKYPDFKSPGGIFKLAKWE